MMKQENNPLKETCCDDTVGITRPIIAINYMKKYEQ